MRCQTEKANIFPLPTLAYDEFTISGTLDILPKLTQVLGLSEEIVRSKIIILKSNLLTIKIAMQTIYRKQDEPTSLHGLDWLKPIIRLFHL